MKTGIEDIMNLLSPSAREALYILSVPSLLQDSLAKTLLIEIQRSNEESAIQLIKKLRYFPIWHERTINSWVFDDDVRDYVLKDSRGSDSENFLKVLKTMKEYRKEFENLGLEELKDYDLQIARLSISLEKSRRDGIDELRQIFNSAYKFNQPETERIIDLYLEEIFPEAASEKTLTEEVSSAYFMRGMHAFKNNKFDKAIHFLVPVWKKNNGSFEAINDAAKSSYLVGLILSEELLHRKEAEDAYNQSIELFKKVNDLFGQAQAYHNLGTILGENRSRWNEAENAYKQSLELFRKIDYSFGLARVYDSLGDLLSKKSSRWKETENVYRQSLELFRKIDYSFGLARVYDSLGNLLSKEPSRWNEAENAYKQSLELFRKTSDSFSQAQVKNLMSKVFTISIGVFVYNEEKNIRSLLNSLLSQRTTQSIKEIIVISSECSDRTDEIVENDFSKSSPKIILLKQKRREGKASAINLFLKYASGDILVLENGDTIPAEYTIENLTQPFKNPKIGMTGGRPIPINDPDTFMGFTVHLLWDLHHKLAIKHPKLSELVAFRRNLIKHIPTDIIVDEAFIEALIREQGYELTYVPDAIVYNKGPENTSEFLRQRRRIFAGYLHLKKTKGYAPSNMEKLDILKLIFEDVRFTPKKILWTFRALFLELYGRALGSYDFYIKKDDPYIWNIAVTTKTNILETTKNYAMYHEDPFAQRIRLWSNITQQTTSAKAKILSEASILPDTSISVTNQLMVPKFERREDFHKEIGRF